MKKRNFRNLLSLLLAFTMIFGTSTMTLASNTSNKSSNTASKSVYSELQTSYNDIINYSTSNNIPLNMSLEEFIDGYDTTQYNSVKDYTNAYYNLLQPNNYNIRSSSSIGDSLWQYNTGTSLPQKANYDKYDLLNVCQKGDIIYESKGGFGITGHTAIVEGIFYDSTQNQYYIRIIEAITDGVVRSVLDDDRVDVKDVTIYRVKDASSIDKTNALSFCKEQLGKSYCLDFQKDTSEYEEDWYCSELVWAAYKNQDIDIETTGWLNEPGITPRDITRSSEVENISFAK